jgi:hypothetical protein
MFNIVTGNERYIKNMPVVGMTPQYYTLPNIATTIPRVDYQFYNPWTGSLGPAFTNALDNVKNTTSTTGGVESKIYNKKGVYVGLVGTSSELAKIEKCLDDHLPEK